MSFAREILSPERIVRSAPAFLFRPGVVRPLLSGGTRPSFAQPSSQRLCPHLRPALVRPRSAPMGCSRVKNEKKAAESAATTGGPTSPWEAEKHWTCEKMSFKHPPSPPPLLQCLPSLPPSRSRPRRLPRRSSTRLSRSWAWSTRFVPSSILPLPP